MGTEMSVFLRAGMATSYLVYGERGPLRLQHPNAARGRRLRPT